ncbi:MAG: hypothetical protein Q7K54_04960 [Candidatus Parcubacteria bacterium]|nr:hypothetical protein [Candidatus Parcubacteria bacterium]
MSDRNIFNQIVYTPLSEALRLLDERRKDPELMAKVEKLLKGDIPEILKNKRCGIMARQLATPNHENRKFISLAKENNLYPVFFEYYDDKFTSNNKYKHSLGKLHIQNGKDNKGNEIIENFTIVDFNKYNGSKLQEVKTIWGESLIDFHKKLFSIHDIHDVHFFNENDWYKKDTKEKPDEFYLKFFLLNTCFGILFENFLTSKDTEGDFTKNVVLPTIEKVMDLTGVKPLIVTIETVDLETDNFWYHHLSIVKNSIKKI